MRRTAAGVGGKAHGKTGRSLDIVEDSTEFSVGSMSRAGPVSLTALLRRQLAEIDGDTNTTWAQRLIETWIMEALKGNFRALQEILVRIDGKLIGDEEVSGAAVVVGEQTAAKLLEALCDEQDDFPGD